MVIIGHLMEGEKRSSALKRLIPGVTQKMFTKQIRELEADGIIHREIYKEIPPKVEYRLTDLGKSFTPVLNELLLLGQKIISKQNQD
jgi:Predicted transcriptional regulators